MKDKLVNLHIIGAQKSGTTALAYFLQQHNNIYVVDGKEAHIFDSPAFLHSHKKMKHARVEYAAKLSQYKGEEYICDATPITWFSPTFLKHCYAYNNAAKFIVVLRNPIERALSHYRMSVNKGHESRSFLTALLLEHFRLARYKNNLSFQSPWRHQSYLTRGCYAPQLRNLFDTIPADQVLLLNQEALIKKHNTVLKSVFQFLNLPYQSIAPERIFCSEKTKVTTNIFFGKCYAKSYYWLKRENHKYWRAIIENASKTADGQN
ncbi:sulfotransferase family protein [Agaribacter flavus]|uniref:Sulfotransferase family protein n=1 Tax=Agaribacter flavus TaxID=1902781 RepID=A0ABV7FNQ2_9ALTE